MGLPTTVQGIVALGPQVGLAATNNVPTSLQAQCNTVAMQNIPSQFASSSSVTSEYQGFIREATAFLIIRGFIYFKNTVGDCGIPAPLGISDAQITGLAGSVATGIASFAGLALPGIGVAVAAVQQIFAHHAQAVATEQEVLCSLMGIMNQVIPYYDAQVRAGNISPSDAYQGMQNFISQVKAQLSAISKPCDAACFYSAILNCHYDFVQYYYPLIAPVQAAPHAPGAPPATNTTTPGGVIQVGASSGGAVLPQPPSSTASRPVAAPVAAVGSPLVGLLSGNIIIWIAVVMGILLLLFA
jgi:hypothetical protein